MSCERYAGAIADHACGAEIPRDAEAHLEACALCRTRFDEQRRAMQALDAELEQALAVAPSPYFEQTVLARIGEARSVRPRTFWWAGLAAAAAGLIVIGLASIRSIDRAAPDETPRVAALPKPISSGTVQAPSAPPVVAQDTGRTLSVPRATPRTREPRRRTVSPPAPAEVIVAAEQSSRAIARYMALVRSGVLDTSALAEPAAESETRPLVVPPLIVDDLTMPTVEMRTGPVDRRGPDGM